MARDLNKAMLIGRLGAEPDMRYTPAGTPVTSFRLAVSRRFRRGDSGEVGEQTDWFTVVAWQKLAELCSEHPSKGSRVYVGGGRGERARRDPVPRGCLPGRACSLIRRCDTPRARSEATMGVRPVREPTGCERRREEDGEQCRGHRGGAWGYRGWGRDQHRLHREARCDRESEADRVGETDEVFGK